jgi:hypothetical protein
MIYAHKCMKLNIPLITYFLTLLLLSLLICALFLYVHIQLGGLSIKNKLVRKILEKPRAWTDSLDKRRKQKMDMRFGTWNVRSILER